MKNELGRNLARYARNQVRYNFVAGTSGSRDAAELVWEKSLMETYVGAALHAHKSRFNVLAFALALKLRGSVHIIEIVPREGSGSG